MGDRISVGINNKDIRDLLTILEKEKGRVHRCATKTVNKYAIKIEASARLNLETDPRRIDDGRLRASIRHLVNRLAALVFTNVDYAPFVHWGTGIHGESPEGGHRKTPWIYFDKKRKQFFVTRGMKANKFLLDAFNEHRDDLLRDLTKCLEG